MKWIKAQIDFDTHRMLNKVQAAELDRFDYLEKRKHEDIIKDALKLGLKEFAKIHELNIEL